MKKILSLLAAVILVVLASLFGITGGEDVQTLPPETAAQVQIQQNPAEEEITPEIADEAASPEIADEAVPPEIEEEEAAPEAPIDVDGSYTTKEDVALYIHTYGCLPGNFITKKEARKLGWEGGGLEAYAPGMCIGGDRFGNYEGLLPEDRAYTECDIDTMGKSSRGAKRIVFSEDGLIYYTDDHYESFELLYGEP